MEAGPSARASIERESGGESSEGGRARSESSNVTKDTPKHKMSGIPRLQQTPTRLRVPQSTEKRTLLQPSPPVVLTASAAKARLHTVAKSPLNKTVKSQVAAMAIVGHWKPNFEDDADDLMSPGADDDENGIAEIAIFAKIIPVPGSTLEIIHLNKNMTLNQGSFRAMPLLPDGTSPRMTPGSAALNIEVVSGRCRRTSDGRTKMVRRKADENTSRDALNAVDGSYDSDGENSSASEDTINSSVARLLTPDMYLDGGFSDTDREQIKVRGEAEAAINVERWLENYNSGTNLTIDRNQRLCISFDENMRKDALVVEIYLSAEPIITPGGDPDAWTFIFGSLPLCPKGIQVSFNVDSRSTDSEYIFVTMPSMSQVHDIGKNIISGTYFSTGNIQDTLGSTLVIRTHKIDSIQEPTNYSTDITTKVGPIPYVQLGNVVFVYKIKIVLNRVKPMESTRLAKLTFEVYNVSERDDWSFEGCPGGTKRWCNENRCMLLEVVRPTPEIFEDIEIQIITEKRMDTLDRVILPKVVSPDGIALAEAVVLEELGDQPLSYHSLEDKTLWMQVRDHPERSAQFSRFYELADFSNNAIHHFCLGIKAKAYPQPGVEIQTQINDGIVSQVKYNIIPDFQLVRGKPACRLNMQISYDVSTMGYHRRIFTIAAGKWKYRNGTIDGTPEIRGLFHPCDDQDKIWIALNDIGNKTEKKHVEDMRMIECTWDKHSSRVGLDEAGHIVDIGAEGADVYQYMEVPCIIDKWVNNLDFALEWKDDGMEESPFREPPQYASGQRHPGSEQRLASPTWRTYPRKKHLWRQKLNNEVFRNERMYVTRVGVRLFVYILSPLPVGGGEGASKKTPGKAATRGKDMERDMDEMFPSIKKKTTPIIKRFIVEDAPLSASPDSAIEIDVETPRATEDVNKILFSSVPEIQSEVPSAVEETTPIMVSLAPETHEQEPHVVEEEPRTPTKVSRTASDDSLDMLESFSPISIPVRDMISPGLRSPKPPSQIFEEPEQLSGFETEFPDLTAVASFESDVTLTTPNDPVHEDVTKKKKTTTTIELETLKRSVSGSAKRSRPVYTGRIQMNGSSRITEENAVSTVTTTTTRHRRHANNNIAREKTKEKKTSSSSSSSSGSALQTILWLFWKMLQLAVMCIIMSIVLTGCVGVYKNTRNVIREFSEVRDEMRKFNEMFESVYGVEFGAGGWKRVQMREEGDLLVLVRGAALEGGDVVLKRVTGDGVGGNKDGKGFWNEDPKGKKQEEGNGGNADGKHDGDEVPTPGGGKQDKSNNIRAQQARKKGFAAAHEDNVDGNAGMAHSNNKNDHDDDSSLKQQSDDGTTMTSKDTTAGSADKTSTEDEAEHTATMAVAAWGRDPKLHSYPWMGVKRAVVAAKDIVEDSWTNFLRAWKAVWYMT
ncbi:hypothetical protein DFH27DRAFT_248294 [Peziza echinospora]|nr:hypothetical protein DFH27DRAFT_248294 [Peziza echinospora]